MPISKYFQYLKLFVLLVFAVTLASCFGSKPVAYFSQGVIDTSKYQVIQNANQVIQKGDQLSITIYSDNPEATAIYNQAGNGAIPPATSSSVTKTLSQSSPNSSSVPSAGYLVDNNGNIYLHAIGQVKAEGLTKDQLNDVILQKLSALGVLSNPYVVTRFSNLKVTILGEVKAPGVFSLPAEKASILEAVGLAGDITDYGRKEKILLIREDQGKRSYHRINLLDPNVFTSEYFYLRQNDMVIVEPDTRKPTALDLQTLQYVTIAATLASTAAIIISLFR